METRKIRNWSRFQHFKDRRPPWIKLYRDLLDDQEWHALDGDAAKMLIMLWLLASEKGGEIPDNKTISFRLRIPLEQVDINMISLRYHLDIIPSQKISATDTPNSATDIEMPLRDRDRDRDRDREETETEPETQQSQSGVQDDLGLPPELDRYGLPMKYDLDEVAREIYAEYPRKDGITEAVKKIKKAFTLIHPIVLYRIVRAYGMLVDQSEERKQFIPMCTTWMNQCKWEADAPIANPPKYVYDPAYEAGDEMWQIEQHKQRVQQFRVDREEGLKAWNEAKALLERMQNDAR